jgi:predicted unusual protein kinase regulating ubiquinone biosynthesis (AarF/ABC1/UbiB family)
MLIYDNFIHADCHAGNIFIRLSEKKNEELSTWESMNKWVEDCQDSIYEGIDKGVQTIFTKYADWQM